MFEPMPSTFPELWEATKSQLATYNPPIPAVDDKPSSGDAVLQSATALEKTLKDICQWPFTLAAPSMPVPFTNKMEEDFSKSDVLSKVEVLGPVKNGPCHIIFGRSLVRNRLLCLVSCCSPAKNEHGRLYRIVHDMRCFIMNLTCKMYSNRRMIQGEYAKSHPGNKSGRKAKNPRAIEEHSLQMSVSDDLVARDKLAKHVRIHWALISSIELANMYLIALLASQLPSYDFSGVSVKITNGDILRQHDFNNFPITDDDVGRSAYNDLLDEAGHDAFSEDLCAEYAAEFEMMNQMSNEELSGQCEANGAVGQRPELQPAQQPPLDPLLEDSPIDVTGLSFNSTCRSPKVASTHHNSGQNSSHSNKQEDNPRKDENKNQNKHSSDGLQPLGSGDSGGEGNDGKDDDDKKQFDGDNEEAENNSEEDEDEEDSESDSTDDAPKGVDSPSSSDSTDSKFDAKMNQKLRDIAKSVVQRASKKPLAEDAEQRSTQRLEKNVESKRDRPTDYSSSKSTQRDQRRPIPSEIASGSRSRSRRSRSTTPKRLSERPREERRNDRRDDYGRRDDRHHARRNRSRSRSQGFKRRYSPSPDRQRRRTSRSPERRRLRLDSEHSGSMGRRSSLATHVKETNRRRRSSSSHRRDTGDTSVDRHKREKRQEGVTNRASEDKSRSRERRARDDRLSSATSGRKEPSDPEARLHAPGKREQSTTVSKTIPAVNNSTNREIQLPKENKQASTEAKVPQSKSPRNENDINCSTIPTELRTEEVSLSKPPNVPVSKSSSGERDNRATTGGGELSSGADVLLKAQQVAGLVASDTPVVLSASEELMLNLGGPELTESGIVGRTENPTQYTRSLPEPQLSPILEGPQPDISKAGNMSSKGASSETISKDGNGTSKLLHKTNLSASETAALGNTGGAQTLESRTLPDPTTFVEPEPDTFSDLLGMLKTNDGDDGLLEQLGNASAFPEAFDDWNADDFGDLLDEQIEPVFSETPLLTTEGGQVGATAAGINEGISGVTPSSISFAKKDGTAAVAIGENQWQDSSGRISSIAQNLEEAEGTPGEEQTGFYDLTVPDSTKDVSASDGAETRGNDSSSKLLHEPPQGIVSQGPAADGTANKISDGAVALEEPDALAAGNSVFHPASITLLCSAKPPNWEKDLAVRRYFAQALHLPAHERVPEMTEFVDFLATAEGAIRLRDAITSMTELMRMLFFKYMEGQAASVHVAGMMQDEQERLEKLKQQLQLERNKNLEQVNNFEKQLCKQQQRYESEMKKMRDELQKELQNEDTSLLAKYDKLKSEREAMIKKMKNIEARNQHVESLLQQERGKTTVPVGAAAMSMLTPPKTSSSSSLAAGLSEGMSHESLQQKASAPAMSSPMQQQKKSQEPRVPTPAEMRMKLMEMKEEKRKAEREKKAQAKKAEAEAKKAMRSMKTVESKKPKSSTPNAKSAHAAQRSAAVKDLEKVFGAEPVDPVQLSSKERSSERGLSSTGAAEGGFKKPVVKASATKSSGPVPRSTAFVQPAANTVPKRERATNASKKLDAFVASRAGQSGRASGTTNSTTHLSSQKPETAQAKPSGNPESVRHSMQAPSPVKAKAYGRGLLPQPQPMYAAGQYPQQRGFGQGEHQLQAPHVQVQYTGQRGQLQSDYEPHRFQGLNPVTQPFQPRPGTQMSFGATEPRPVPMRAVQHTQVGAGPNQHLRLPMQPVPVPSGSTGLPVLNQGMMHVGSYRLPSVAMQPPQQGSLPGSYQPSGVMYASPVSNPPRSDNH